MRTRRLSSLTLLTALVCFLGGAAGTPSGASSASGAASVSSASGKSGASSASGASREPSAPGESGAPRAYGEFRAPAAASSASAAASAVVPDSRAAAARSDSPNSPNSGHRAEKPRPGDHRLSLTWKGKQRTYLVHAPPGYRPSQRLPLVVALHPYPSSGAYMRTLSRFNAEADEERFLVSYPDGVDGGFNALACCGDEDDVGFIGAMTRHLERVWRAHPDRVYAAGISNGGDMSLRLAVELPGRFAAVAPVSSGFIGKALEDESYAPEKPVSLITFLGGQDPYYAQFQTGLRAWHQRLGCRQGPPKPLPEGNTRTRGVCADGSRTAVYDLPRMGHQWPGSPDPIMGAPDAGLDATDLIWDFFKKHPRKGR